jgi:surfeit locus 1 family protein
MSLAATARDRGLVWPTLAAAVALVVLLALGTWQWQRMQWKEALIATIAARITAPPVPLAEAERRMRGGEPIDYLRVAVSGRFLPDRERHYWTAGPAGPGWHIYAPLALDDGRILIVNRGFVPDARRDPATRPEPTGDRREIVGLLRSPEVKGTFTPDNNEPRNIWYWRDLDGMARSMLGKDAAQSLPFFLEAERRAAGSPAPDGVPEGGATRLALPNNHLQYAMTWYGLALTLLGVYVAFVRSRCSAPRPGRS